MGAGVPIIMTLFWSISKIKENDLVYLSFTIDLAKIVIFWTVWHILLPQHSILRDMFIIEFSGKTSRGASTYWLDCMKLMIKSNQSSRNWWECPPALQLLLAEEQKLSLLSHWQVISDADSWGTWCSLTTGRNIHLALHQPGHSHYQLQSIGHSDN